MDNASKTLVALVKRNAGCDQPLMLHVSDCQMVNRGRGQSGKCTVISESEARDLAEESGNKLVMCKCTKVAK